MVEALNRDPDAQPADIIQNVRGAIDGFVAEAPQFDDITMLAVKWGGGSVLQEGKDPDTTQA